MTNTTRVCVIVAAIYNKDKSQLASLEYADIQSGLGVSADNVPTIQNRNYDALV